jgi:hypothetical protein
MIFTALDGASLAVQIGLNATMRRHVGALVGGAIFLARR